MAVLLPHWLGYSGHSHSDEQYSNVESTISQTLLANKLIGEHGVHDEETALTHNDSNEADSHLHGNETAATLLRFVSLSLHAAPALLLAYLLTWLINYIKPAFNVLGQLRARNPVSGALKGTLVGLPLPICIPNAASMYKQLIKAGCGSALAISFLVASPVLGFDALLISLPLLGSDWVLIRLVTAIALAVTLGLLIGVLFAKRDADPAIMATPAQLQQSNSRLKQAFEHGFAHLIDHTAPWVLFGLIAAASFTPTIGWQFFQQEPWLQVLLAIIIALPFHICATGITPVLAVLLIAGVSPGAVVAFSLVGPSLNLDLYRFIKQNQGKQIAIAVVLAIVGMAAVLGLLVMYWVPELPKPWLTLAPHWQQDWWRYLCLLIIAILFAISILRRGARSFMLELLPHSLRNRRHSHDHGQGHSHSHSQGHSHAASHVHRANHDEHHDQSSQDTKR